METEQAPHELALIGIRQLFPYVKQWRHFTAATQAEAQQIARGFRLPAYDRFPLFSCGRNGLRESPQKDWNGPLSNTLGIWDAIIIVDSESNAICITITLHGS